MKSGLQVKDRTVAGAKPGTAALHDPARFEVIADVAHGDVISFVQPFIFQLSRIPVLYWLLNTALLGFLVWEWRRTSVPVLEAFSTVCLGMVLGFVVLLPIHEHIHGLAYRLCGANVVRVKYNLRRITALCEAPGAVVSGGHFVFVCLAPLFVLNPLLALPLLFLVKWKAIALVGGALLLHTGACSGDIGLVNFVWQHRGQRLFTYDDGELQRAFFFKERP
ncbi:DUF3267 domain-containing protein [Occallatibacter savannae]|uniref:DUF3267 domain-containing protein n=1 Tax=Occallatibacter savannae TaxID=1002691 RepID=UPI000D68CB30|nr:DUF3267 domain-containing protein [Occallatibacter savannae]